MNIKENKKLNDCYQELFQKVIDLQLKYPNQMIAGTMMAQALRIYRSTLDDNGFKGMMETIIERSDEIEPYKKTQVH